MSTGHIYFAPEVDQKTLVGWLQAWFKDGAFRLGIRADDTGLDRFQPKRTDEDVTNWSQGRVFSAKCEVRWEQRGQTYAVWLLGEVITPPPELTEVEGPWTVAGGRRPHLYLWGRYDETWTQRTGRPTWIEVRIPRPLHYPAEPPPTDEADTAKLFARIGHVDYRAPNGAVQFVRLTEVK